MHIQREGFSLFLNLFKDIEISRRAEKNSMILSKVDRKGRVSERECNRDASVKNRLN